MISFTQAQYRDFSAIKPTNYLCSDNTVMWKLRDTAVCNNIDTDSPTGMLICTVLSAITQFERDIIVQRTKEGIVSAKKRGIKFGRPRADNKAVEKIYTLYDSKAYSYKDISDMTGVSISTVYRYLKEGNRI